MSLFYYRHIFVNFEEVFENVRRVATSLFLFKGCKKENYTKTLKLAQKEI